MGICNACGRDNKAVIPNISARLRKNSQPIQCISTPNKSNMDHTSPSSQSNALKTPGINHCTDYVSNTSTQANN